MQCRHPKVYSELVPDAMIPERCIRSAILSGRRTGTFGRMRQSRIQCVNVYITTYGGSFEHLLICMEISMPYLLHNYDIFRYISKTLFSNIYRNIFVPFLPERTISSEVCVRILLSSLRIKYDVL